MLNTDVHRRFPSVPEKKVLCTANLTEVGESSASKGTLSHRRTEKVCHVRKSIFRWWMAMPCHAMLGMNVCCKNKNKERFAY